MFYRVSAVLILAFWVVMMALLVRVEFSTNAAEIMPVPVDYVWKLMFLHDQASDLTLYNQHVRIGSFHLQPSRLPTATDGTGGPVRILSGSGSLVLSLPGVSNQSITLRGSLELDERSTVERFGVNVSFHPKGQNAPGLSVVLDGQPEREQWHYQLRRGEAIQQEASGTSAVLLDSLNLNSLGIDSKTLLQAGHQQMAATKVTARRGVLHTNGEDIESYVVTARQAESLETTMYISQLGQILAVKTFTGYDLYDESIAP